MPDTSKKDAIPRDREKLFVCEVAEILRSSNQFVYNLIYAGELRAFNRSGPGAKKSSYLVYTQSLEDYMTRREEGAHE